MSKSKGNFFTVEEIINKCSTLRIGRSRMNLAEATQLTTCLCQLLGRHGPPCNGKLRRYTGASKF